MSGYLNIQWKGTNLCADFKCSCGLLQHICNITFAKITCGVVVNRCEEDDCGCCPRAGEGCGKKWTLEHDATVLLKEA